MTEAPDDQPSREDLLRARDSIREQIELLESPMDGRNANPGEIARLRALWDEINELLGEAEES